jgi:RNA polymerase sigma-70 factor (ECF subfamily)
VSNALESRIRDCLDRGELEQAATFAIRGYGPELLGYVVAILRDPDAGRDVFGQLSEDLWRGIGSFRGESSFRTWAYTLAWRAARRFDQEAYRRRVRRLATSEVSKLAASVRSSTADRRKGLARRLRESLPPEDQTLLILRIDRGLSWAEVGQVMEVSPAAAKKRYERVKQRLRAIAEREGLESS